MISHFYLSLVYLASCLLHFTFLLLLVTAFHFPITTCHSISLSYCYLSQHFTFLLLLVTAFHFPITTCHSISLSYYYLSQHFTFLLLLITDMHGMVRIPRHGRTASKVSIWLTMVNSSKLKIVTLTPIANLFLFVYLYHTPLAFFLTP